MAYVDIATINQTIGFSIMILKYLSVVSATANIAKNVMFLSTIVLNGYVS